MVMTRARHLVQFPTAGFVQPSLSLTRRHARTIMTLSGALSLCIGFLISDSFSLRAYEPCYVPLVMSVRLFLLSCSQALLGFGFNLISRYLIFFCGSCISNSHVRAPKKMRNGYLPRPGTWKMYSNINTPTMTKYLCPPPFVVSLLGTTVEPS